MTPYPIFTPYLIFPFPFFPLVQTFPSHSHDRGPNTYILHVGDSAVSPTGATDAFKVLATTNIAYHWIAYRKYVATVTYTFSAVIKAAGENEVMMQRLYNDQNFVNLQVGSFATS